MRWMVDELLLCDPISPPRRYSVVLASSAPEWQSPRLRIYLDGAEVSHVSEYDCDAGTVERLVTDEQGRFKVDAEGRAVERELMRGNVTVEWND